jgi:hypothetical protein
MCPLIVWVIATRKTDPKKQEVSFLCLVSSVPTKVFNLFYPVLSHSLHPFYEVAPHYLYQIVHRVDHLSTSFRAPRLVYQLTLKELLYVILASSEYTVNSYLQKVISNNSLTLTIKYNYTGRYNCTRQVCLQQVHKH